MNVAKNEAKEAEIIQFPQKSKDDVVVPRIRDGVKIINHKASEHEKVYIVGHESAIEAMFRARGYQVTYDPDEAGIDLVCFTGGADVSPIYYQQKTLPGTSCNPTRDEREIAIYKRFIDTPKVGICRGGQFLNIMSGGRMFQDMNGHGRDHITLDLLIYKKALWMTSTHHQMMIPGVNGHVLAIAKQSTYKKSALATEEVIPYDIEVVYYESTKSLCFQPHPEYVDKNHDCNIYFFELLNTLL